MNALLTCVLHLLRDVLKVLAQVGVRRLIDPAIPAQASGGNDDLGL